MLKFHLDENADWSLAEGLRRHRINVTTTPPALPKGTPDKGQLEYTLYESRVIVTRDRDMLILASQGIDHAGIAFYRANSKSIGQLIARLVTIAKVKSAENLKGHVEYL